MKKYFAGILATSLIMFTLSACGSQNPTETTRSAAEVSSVSAETDQTSSAVPATAADPSQAQTASGTQAASPSGQTEIGEEAAKQTALSDAGVSESDTVYLSVKRDFDDGRLLYDVEFYAGSTEYDYEIDAYSGSVLSFDQDIEHYSPDPAPASDAAVSLEAAKSAALDAAGLTEDAVTFTKTKLDRDDGIALYEIEFVSGETEYEFEISAADGSILEYNRESIYD